MSTNRTLRTPLTVGMLAVTAAFGLSACVPTDGGDTPEETAVETTEAAQPTEQPTEESTPDTEGSEAPETERPSEDADDDASESSDEETGTDAKGGAVDGGDEKKPASGDGDTVDAGAMNGEPVEVVDGSGGGTVEIPEHDEPLVVVFENTSDDEFSYIYGEADTGEGLPGVDSGESTTFLLDPYGTSGGLASNTSEWDMQADDGDSYTISFYEMNAIPEAGEGDTVEADGSGLVRWNSEEDAYMAVEHDGESNFIVHGESPEDDGSGTQYVFNEIGAVTGGLEIEEGEYIIAVDADGSWSFTPMTEEEYEAADTGSES